MARMTAHLAASAAGSWTPSDWIALAGVVATALGVLATLGGVRLGARMVERDTRRRDAEAALVAVELAYSALNVQDLSTEDLIDDSQGVDNSKARMARILKADAARLAHDAITALIARRGEGRVITVARELDARLSTVQQLVADWYARQIRARQIKHTNKDAALAEATQSLAAAQRALSELRLKTDELREVMLRK